MYNIQAESNMSGIAFLETRYAHPFFAPNKSKPWGYYDPFSWYPKPNQPKHQTVLNVQIPQQAPLHAINM